MYANTQSRQNGATLLEVMVAIVVLSFGLLGMAGLQMTALKANQVAMQGSQSSMLGYDILDRMRANLVAAKRGDYTKSSLSGRAKTDVEAWQARLVEALGDGAKGTICRASISDVSSGCASQGSGSGNAIKVHITWNTRELVAGEAASGASRQEIFVTQVAEL